MSDDYEKIDPTGLGQGLVGQPEDRVYRSGSNNVPSLPLDSEVLKGGARLRRINVLVTLSQAYPGREAPGLIRAMVYARSFDEALEIQAMLVRQLQGAYDSSSIRQVADLSWLNPWLQAEPMSAERRTRAIDFTDGPQPPNEPRGPLTPVLRTPDGALYSEASLRDGIQMALEQQRLQFTKEREELINQIRILEADRRRGI
jgi:hypothetical protein